MIDLHYWPTPNGWKISIMLFECGLPFKAIPVNIMAGEYSIADMAIFPWVVPHKAQGIAIANHPNVQRWFTKLRERPGVKAGMELLAELRRGAPPPDAKTRELLFGIRPTADKPVY